jgi:formylglycine-generating enzyme required for sulfatase activity
MATVIASLLLLAPWTAARKPAVQPLTNQIQSSSVPAATRLAEPFSDETASLQQIAWARKLGLPVVETNCLQLKLCLIPPGEFPIGYGSVARITKPFYMSSTEVTVEAFAEFVDATQYQTQGERSGDGGWIHSPTSTLGIASNPEYTWDNKRFAFDNQLPVTMVTLQDIDAFAAWLSEREGRIYRLPSYAEWTWASHAGAPKRLKSPDPICMSEMGWHLENSDNQAQPVAKKRSNPWGLYDLFGNVTEILQDTIPRKLAMGVFDDPLYTSTAQSRSGCGGSFADPMHSILHDLNPNMPLDSVGFRLVLEIPSQDDIAATK